MSGELAPSSEIGAVPGFAVCLVLAIVVSLVTPRSSAQAMREFDAMEASLATGEIQEEKTADAV